MTATHPGRKLSNVKLTGRHHFRYNGIWILISTCLVILIDVLLYLLMEERWSGLHSSHSSVHAQYVSTRQIVLGTMGGGTILFVIGIVWLAKFNAHRIAGPYIRLTNVFRTVRDGNLHQSLKFRSYDHLEEVEKTFDEMMSAVRERIERASQETR